MSDELVVKDERALAPGFDARARYTDALAKLIPQLNISIQLDDLETWYKTLKMMMTMCSPYVKSVNRDELTAQFVLVENNFEFMNQSAKGNVGFVRNKIRRVLWLIQSNIFDYGKMIFLPTSDREEEQWDIDEFMRRAKER